MKNLIIITLLFLSSLISFSQVEKADCVYEIVTDSISYMNYDFDIKTYRTGSIKNEKIIKFFQIGNEVYVYINSDMIKLPYQFLVDGKLVYSETKNVDDKAYVITISGLLVLSDYDFELSNYTSITYYRSHKTEHYYGENYEEELENFKKLIKKANKKEDKKTKRL